ncbi:hypothetical protein D3C76_1707380 [compost metagenome]
MAGGYQIAQPLRCEWIDLVVVRGRLHADALMTSSNTNAANIQKAPLTRKAHAHAWCSVQFLIVLFII